MGIEPGANHGGDTERGESHAHVFSVTQTHDDGQAHDQCRCLEPTSTEIDLFTNSFHGANIA